MLLVELFSNVRTLVVILVSDMFWFCLFCRFCLVLSLLSCFDNNLKLHLAFVKNNVCVTVFSFMGHSYISILLSCLLYLLFVEFMTTMHE